MICGLGSRNNWERIKIEALVINPDRFADAVYESLKEKNND